MSDTATTATQPESVTISGAELARLRDAESRLTTIESEQRQRQRESEIANATGRAQQGDPNAVATIVAQAEARETELRQRLHNRELDFAVSDGIAGVTFITPEAARDARAKLSAEFQVSEVEGRVEIRHKTTGRLLSDVVQERLRSPEYSHFLRAATMGGAGIANADRTARAIPGNDIASRLLEHERAQRATGGGGAIGLRTHF